MTWWRGGSNNERGAFLPNETAELETETERIHAHNRQEAKEKCKEIAEEYGGTDPEVVAKGKQDFDCTFKVWR